MNIINDSKCRIINNAVPIPAYDHGATELDCVSLKYGHSFHMILSRLQTTVSFKYIVHTLTISDAQLQCVTHSGTIACITLCIITCSGSPHQTMFTLVSSWYYCIIIIIYIYIYTATIPGGYTVLARLSASTNSIN